MESDVFTPRQARRAGRPAIHAGGAHRIEELFIGLRVTGNNRRPAHLIIIEVRSRAVVVKVGCMHGIDLQ